MCNNDFAHEKTETNEDKDPSYFQRSEQKRQKGAL